MQPVAEADVGVDVPRVRQGGLELHPQLAHVHVDGAVPVAQRPAPGQREQLLAADDAPRAPRERDEQLELADGEDQGLAGGDHQAAGGEDLELADHEPVVGGAGGVHGGRVPPGSDGAVTRP